MKHGSGNKRLLVGRLDTKQNRRGHMCDPYIAIFLLSGYRVDLQICLKSISSNMFFLLAKHFFEIRYGPGMVAGSFLFFELNMD